MDIINRYSCTNLSNYNNVEEFKKNSLLLCKNNKFIDRFVKVNHVYKNSNNSNLAPIVTYFYLKVIIKKIFYFLSGILIVDDWIYNL